MNARIFLNVMLAMADVNRSWLAKKMGLKRQQIQYYYNKLEKESISDSKFFWKALDILSEECKTEELKNTVNTLKAATDHLRQTVILKEQQILNKGLGGKDGK